MSRPSRFRIEFQSKRRIAHYLRRHPDDQGLEFATPDEIYESDDVAEVIANARARARAFARQNDCTVTVYERRNIRDVTPAGDPSGLIFDWDEEWVEDIEPPVLEAS